MRIRRALTAHLPRHPCQPQRPAPRELFAVVEKADADRRTVGLLLLFIVVDRRGRPRHPPREVRTIGLYPNDVYPADTCRTKLPIRAKRHAEPVPGSIATPP